MSMVHASSGKLKPASRAAFGAGDCRGDGEGDALPESKVDWLSLVADYDRIRDLIEQTIPGFDQYNQRIRHPGGFRMPLPPTERIWPTPTGKAMFSVFTGAREPAGRRADVMRLVTLRSHDQYNTTIYAMDDRYRGVFGRRDVLFMNEQDMAEQGFEHGDRGYQLRAAGPPTAAGRYHAGRLQHRAGHRCCLLSGSQRAGPADYLDKRAARRINRRPFV
jgi:anaerobic selenocysteine-containing dehydrogenase